MEHERFRKGGERVFVLQKVVASFVELPGLVCSLLLAWGLFFWLFRKERKKSLWVFLIAFVVYLSSSPVFVRPLVGTLEGAFPPFTLSHDAVKGDGDENWIVVLSSGQLSGFPVHFSSQTGDVLDPICLARLNCGFSLSQKTSWPILVTGGLLGGAFAPVAETMAVQLREWGVADSLVFVENQAKTTAQNAALSVALLPPSVKTLYLVTSANHMKRAMLVFSAFLEGRGIQLVAVPCDYSFDVATDWFDWLPSISAFSALASAWHEWVGIVFYHLSGEMKT